MLSIPESAKLLRFAADECPDAPGVYVFKDKLGRVLYVGKAKNLRKRLASYFRLQASLAFKTRAMLARAANLDVLRTGTEKEALLLESSLIKKHRPRYNICLRDDKQYVLFKLDFQTDFPRLTLTRRVVRDGSLYFGPFTSAHAARQTLKAVHRLFPLRRCKDSVFRNRVRPCLYHDMRQCLAPCVWDVSREEYADMVRRVRLFLAGKSGELAAHLRAVMKDHAARLEYEKAAEARDLLEGVTRTLEQQAVVLGDGLDRDVLGFVQDARGLGASVLFIRRGRLLDSKRYFWPRADEIHSTKDAKGEKGPEAADLQEIMDTFLVQFYESEQFIPERIVLPAALKNPHVAEILAERRGAAVHLQPARGADEKRLLEMAEANAWQAVPADGQDAALVLARGLGLKETPRRIEAVDVSHLAGRGTVVGLVVFEDGRPVREDFRAYVFPELEGTSDDYLALARFARHRAGSGRPGPDLMVVDGGLGQLAAVGRALEEAGLAPSWPLAGIAKVGRRAGELRDRVFVPGRKNPLPLEAGGPGLLFLQRLRDAAHRFAISRLRRNRRKAVLDSRLAGLKGIGPKTAKLLWENFPDVAAMRRASVRDLAALPGIGAKRAVRLHEVLQGIGAG